MCLNVCVRVRVRVCVRVCLCIRTWACACHVNTYTITQETDSLEIERFIHTEYLKDIQNNLAEHTGRFVVNVLNLLRFAFCSQMLCRPNAWWVVTRLYARAHNLR